MDQKVCLKCTSQLKIAPSCTLWSIHILLNRQINLENGQCTQRILHTDCYRMLSLVLARLLSEVYFGSYQLFTITGCAVTVPDYWSTERRWATRTSSWLCLTWEAVWTLTARATLRMWCGWGTVTTAANYWLTSWAGGWVSSTNSSLYWFINKNIHYFPVFCVGMTPKYAEFLF